MDMTGKNENAATGHRGQFLVVPLEPGENRIEIAARLSPLRRVLLGLDILIALGTLWFWKRERRTSASPTEERKDG